MNNFPVEPIGAERSLPQYTSLMHGCCSLAKRWLILILQNEANDPLIFN